MVSKQQQHTHSNTFLLKIFQQIKENLKKKLVTCKMKCTILYRIQKKNENMSLSKSLRVLTESFSTKCRVGKMILAIVCES